MPVGHSPVLSRKKPAALPTPAARFENREERRPPILSQSSTSKNDKPPRGGIGGGRDAAPESEAVEDVDDFQGGNSAGEGTGMEKVASKPIGKLDDSVYRMFGHAGSGSVSSLSRSSSDTGSEGAICSGGPNKVCGNPVKDGDAGVGCDKCHEWFHTACQGIPKPAVKALEKFECLAWLCTRCKSDLKDKHKRTLPRQNEYLELTINQLEKMLQTHMELVSSSVQAQEKLVQEQTSMLEKSKEMCKNIASDQLKTMESTFRQQTASYADAVKGTCTEVTKMVQSQIASLPKPSSDRNNKVAQDLSRALDDHLDREKRKANLVVHNLPEQDGSSLSERSENDITLFTAMLREVMKINVSASKSFRVGKRHTDRPRLLIVTLDNPASKHDILRYAPQLRNSDTYGNIYISPDLTQKEREANKKLREELSSRRKAGESNLVIKGGRIVQVPGKSRTAEDTTVNSSVPGGGGSRQTTKLTPHHIANASLDGAATTPVSDISKHTKLTQQESASTSHDNKTPAPSDGSIGCPSHLAGPPTTTPDGEETPAALCSGSRGQPVNSTGHSTTSPEGEEAPLALCSGSEGKLDQPMGLSTAAQDGDVTPTVLCSGSTGQLDQPSGHSSTMPSNETSAALIGSSKGQLNQTLPCQQSHESSESEQAPAVPPTTSSELPAQTQSSTENKKSVHVASQM